MLLNKSYTLPQAAGLTNIILKHYINLFFSEVFTPLFSESKPVHLMIMIKVEFSDESMGYRSLADLRKVNLSDLNAFILYITDRLGILSDSYKDNPVKNIIFTYLVKDGLAEGDRMLLQQAEYKVSVHKFNNMLLPLTMIPSEYGEVLMSDSNRVIVRNSMNDIFIIDISADGLINNVSISGAKDVKWTDTKLSEDLFKREIGKSIHYIQNSSIVVSEKVLNAKPFRGISKDSKLVDSNTIMTIDIETMLLENKQIPYLICGYTESKDKKPMYIHNFVNKLPTSGSAASIKKMFKDFIAQLIALKDIKVVYAHNLSGFDGILLLKHLINYPGAKVDPLIFNGKLMSIKFTIKLDNQPSRVILFKDSLLFLPVALRKLCTYFKVDEVKTYFPFSLTDINYSGPIPDFDLWMGISGADYIKLSKEYQNKEWNFKNEALKYCKLDCKSLFDILNIFNKLIFEHFSINPHHPKIISLPGLAMRIFKAHYLLPNTIYQLLGNVERDIREAYTGGAVDVYIPHNGIHGNPNNAIREIGRKDLFYYDVNSLYPFIMSNVTMPAGKPIVFEGDITKIDPNVFGFLYCKISSPAKLNEPILQRKIKTSDGIRTIAGLGTWEGWIFSEEMKIAANNFGYTFEVLRGYKFDQLDLFSGFVSKMYELRTEFAKDHPMNLIAKLLMNSLYGKFGMKAQKSIIEMFDLNISSQKQSATEIFDNLGESITDYIELDHHLILIRNNIANYMYDESKDLYHGLDVNIAIAAAVTAGGRMWMSVYKNHPNFNLYYSDTDSVIINQPLPDNVVGNKLGQVKLECIIKKAVFLAPKVYGLITKNGEEIIKIKGVTKETMKNIHFNDLQSLLKLDKSMNLHQEKWVKNIFKGEINTLEVAYLLKVTNNKRKPLYTVGSLFTNTEPYYYSELE